MMNVYKSLFGANSSESSETKGISVVLGAERVIDSEKKVQIQSTLRRTLSADMSSQNWISSISQLRKSSSYQLFDGFSSSEEDGEDSEEDEAKPAEEEDVWNLINHKQSDNFSTLIPRVQGKPSSGLSQFDSHKTFVHPNAKKRVKLSDKSLELCTEGLGSETGCDSSLTDSSCFSSSSSSSDSDDEDFCQIEEVSPHVEKFSTDLHLPSFSSRKVRSFPPPLPTLSNANGSSVQMRSVKEDGRFTLKAVQVASQKCLQASRQNGRLKLHFISQNPPKAPEVHDTDDSQDEVTAIICNSTNNAIIPDSHSNSEIIAAPIDRGFAFHLLKDKPKFRDINNNNNTANTVKKPVADKPKCNEISSRNDLMKNDYIGWRKTAVECPQTLVTSSTLLAKYSHHFNNNHNDHKSTMPNPNECAHSLPNFTSQKPSAGRCKDKRSLLNMEPYRVAVTLSRAVH